MIRLLLLVAFLFSAFPAFASALPMDHFKQIPILDEGRVKPLDSFARVTLKKLSGKETLRDVDAIEFLATALFDPNQAIVLKVFKIENSNLRHRFGVKDQDGFLYSYQELVPGLKKTSPSLESLLKKEQSKQSKDEEALLDLHDRALGFTSLLRSLSLVLPLDVSLPHKYAATAKERVSYLDIRKIEQDLLSDAQKIVAAKGDDFNRYTDDEKRIALLSYQLQLMASSAIGNETLKIIPPQWQSENSDWHAPWELIRGGQGSPATAALMSAWRLMGDAYLNGNGTVWTESVATAQRLATSKSLKLKLQTEVLQNSYQPIKISTALYILAFASILGFLALAKPYIRTASLAFLSAGAFVHATGLLLRVFILERPPVGTLYESMIFVSLIAVLISFFVERTAKNGSGLLIGSTTGFMIGLVSFAFTGDGDTMTMLTAVLNTNFWLATHVLCITMGYGWCILAALLAHVALLTRDSKSDTAIQTLSLFALLFTTVGTILGGIWADQSWGRFWGWDPKENGALLIVLWLVWLLHGKLGNQLNRVHYFAGIAYLNVIVAVSWVGVNLLGVGLHSYGFADGYFYGLGLFVALETALIGYLWKRHA